MSFRSFHSSTVPNDNLALRVVHGEPTFIRDMLALRCYCPGVVRNFHAEPIDSVLTGYPRDVDLVTPPLLSQPTPGYPPQLFRARHNSMMHAVFPPHSWWPRHHLHANYPIMDYVQDSDRRKIVEALEAALLPS